MKNFRKLFASKSDSPGAKGRKIDQELKEVIRELRLKEYEKAFIENGVVYADLPKLSDEELKQLVPLKIPRGRLKTFIKNTFLASNGWEIDPSFVTIDEEATVIKTGSYGKIKTGHFKVGISSIRIAIKEIVIDDVTTNKESTINEVVVMSKLRNRNVVACYGMWFSNEGQVANIALELCEKGDLFSFRKNNPNMTPIQKMDFLIQIAQGMSYIHSKNLLHRDLKPQNVLVASDEKTLKICDFGTSKSINKVQGTLCGTPAYLSPEQFEGRNISNPKLIDVYAFGIIGWELWTGLIPYATLQKKYRSNTFKFLMAIHGNQDDSKPKIARPDCQVKELEDCPEDLIDLFQGCWDPDDQERPPTFDFIVEELSFYQGELKKKLED